MEGLLLHMETDSSHLELGEVGFGRKEWDMSEWEDGEVEDGEVFVRDDGEVSPAGCRYQLGSVRHSGSVEQLDEHLHEGEMEERFKWRDFGSSVELAPSLMTIYDNYASGQGSTVKADAECNHNTLPAPPLGGLGVQHAPAGPPGGDSGHPSPPPAPVVYGKDDVESMAAVGSGAALRQGVNRPYGIMDGTVKPPGESGESDGPPSALGPAGGYPNHYQGCFTGDPSKKRPLSVSSTSSTTSSTSSLPRPQRKKVAGGVNTHALQTSGGSPLVANGLLHTGSGVYMIHDHVAGSGVVTATSGGATVMRSAGSGAMSIQLPGAVDIADSAMEEEDGDETPSPTTTTPSMTSPRGEVTRQNSAASSGSMTYIDKVVAEILETERTYVHDLNEIIQGYLRKLQNDPECPLDAADINALFGNIEEIYSFNKVFLEELETCQEDAVRLAQCFVDQNEGFVIYSDYCTNYPGAVEVLTAVMGSNEKAEVFRLQQARLSHNLPLGAYLLKPVQRILKYHLLLQNMLTHMDEDGAEVVSAALASMTNMAAHINEMKRKHEHAVRTQEMQSLLYDWAGADLTTYGEFVLEETFRMHGAKGDRHLLLFEKGLLIAKHKDDAGLQIKDCIKCSNLMLVESIPREPLSFHVIPFDNPRGQYTFQARCLDQKRQWCLELKRLILESYTADKAIPSSVKDKVLTLTSRSGARDSSGHGLHHPPGTPKSCPAPDYLDRKRRPRRRSVTSVLPDFAHLKSQVTKKVLPKKGDCASPRMSPRMHRRRQSESAILRGTVGQLFDKHKKQELLCQVEDLSDTDSAEPGPYRSMESLDSTPPRSSSAAAIKPSRAREARHSLPRLTAGNIVDASSCLTDDTWYDPDQESGRECVDGVSAVSAQHHWPPDALPGRDEGSGRDSASPSPLKRRDSFRIATMLHRVDSRKPPGGKNLKRGPLQRDAALADVQLTPLSSKAADNTTAKPPVGRGPRALLRSWRRVSEGDLQYLTKELEDAAVEVDRDCGYVTVHVPALQVNAENDGDDEAEDEPLYLTVDNLQNGVQLVEDDEGDFSEMSLHPGYTQGDPNNNPTSITDNHSLALIANEHVNSMENIRHFGPLAQHGHLVTKGLRVEGASASERLPWSQSCLACPRAGTPDKKHSLHVTQSRCDRSPSPCALQSSDRSVTQGTSVSTSPHPNNLNNVESDQTGLYDNVHCHWDSGCQGSALLQSHLNANLQSGELGCANKNGLKGRKNSKATLAPQIGNLPRTGEHKSRSRLRSNSLNSLADSSADGLHAKYGHRRLPSDTLVFINRNAFVSSGSPGVIRHDVDTERAIARLATPPRDLGPSDIIQQIQDCQERGRIVNRYATPPRTLSDSVSLSSTGTVIANSHSHSDESEGCVGVAASPAVVSGEQNLRPRCHSTLPGDMRYTGPAMLNDLEDYIMQSQSLDTSPSVLAPFPTSASSPDNHAFYRQSSLNEAGLNSFASSPRSDSRLQSPTLSSPSSVMSSDSIVDLLKQAMFSFTSRIASHLPRNTEGSPRCAPRCRSISALEELRVETLQEQQKPLRKKDRRGRFVAQLAKVYTEHVKKRGRSASVERSHSLNLKDKDSTKLTRQLTNLLREGNPGSSVIGERMATGKPLVLGPYTLPRHRPPRPKKSGSGSKTRESTPHPEAPLSVPVGARGEESPDTVVRRRSQSQKVESCHSSAYDSGCLDVGVKDLTLEGADHHGHTTLQATLEAFNLVYSGMDIDDDDDEAYYYERKFVEDLESNFGDDAFRDSAVYSDDGCTVTDPETTSTNVSIRDTMKLIEQRSKTRSVPRTEIRQEEKAKGIKDILRSLELAAQVRLESANLDRPLDSEISASEKAMLKSIRDRTRELVECASLTRIRQSACSVLEDMPNGDEEGPVEGAVAAGSPPLRRGWVKQVVTLLQEHPEQLLSSSED